MDTDAARQPGENPATVYSRRFNELLGLQATEQRREKRLGFAKVVLALLTLVSGVMFLRNPIVLEFLLAPSRFLCSLPSCMSDGLSRFAFANGRSIFTNAGLRDLKIDGREQAKQGNAFSNLNTPMRAIWTCLVEGRYSN